jgi:hypothetical protein
LWERLEPRRLYGRPIKSIAAEAAPTEAVGATLLWERLNPCTAAAASTGPSYTRSPLAISALLMPSPATCSQTKAE